MKTKRCPECGKNMILWRTPATTLQQARVVEQEWWCACGYSEETDPFVPKSDDQVRYERWQRAQDIQNGNGVRHKPTKKLISVRLDERLVEKLQAVADERHETVSSILREAVEYTVGRGVR